MQSESKRDMILTVQNGYLVCPRCRSNKKVVRVDPDTKARNLAVFCRHCKWTARVDIDEGQCFESQSQ